MSGKVLFVDDDPNILEAYSRNCRKYYDVDTTERGEKGLEILSSNGAYAVVVSDLRMPGMDGIEFLSRVKEQKPDSIRIMLTGNADLQTAIESVNKGNIFRFLIKPCNADILKKALDDGIRQYELVNAERELLEKTLTGSIKVLTEVLSLVNPIAFGQASRVKTLVTRMAKLLNLSNPWKYEIAAMLSQVGCVTIPPDVLKKVYLRQQLGDSEKQMLEKHPEIARGIIKNIPRLEEVAEIIAHQNSGCNGNLTLNDSSSEKEIRTGINLLKLALDYDILETSGLSKKVIFSLLERKPECYDPEMFYALKLVIKTESEYQLKSVTINELTIGMVFEDDLSCTDGLLLVAKGQEVTETLCQRLKNYARTAGLLDEKIRVHVPVLEQ